MTLSIGDRIGRYETLGALGVGRTSRCTFPLRSRQPTGEGSFRVPATGQMMRERVVELLGLDEPAQNELPVPI